ncbi:MAG: DUF192 domain-containing protein [Candidatus Omnitrophica bacterium]|nr:DUF192 domain-containing protein [Candidatus Omnitrophota bacterium]MDD5429573.1 DUF192 domain-containing protein [Candidatus Omnitrophota bacterium]
MPPGKFGYCIKDKVSGKIISRQARVADNFYRRFMGLMFRNAIREEEALIFYHAPSIHTFFMKFPIDVVFLNKNMKVIRIAKSLRPWKAVTCLGSYVALEFAADTASRCHIKEGDTIDITAFEP